MRAAPRLMFVLFATLGAAGCRTLGTEPISRDRPPVARARSAFDVDEFVAEHNQNADRIRSLEARPSIAAAMGPSGNRTNEGHLDGRLAMERPRNFKLELYHIKSTFADIGSNDERSWFWVQNSKDKSVYVCDHAELSSTALAATYQPDWIVEAMGLRPIAPDEATRIKVRPGPEPATTALILPAIGTGPQAYSRVMIVSNLTRKVQEYRVISPDGKNLMAQATIKKYRDLPIPKTGEAAGGVSESCYVPENIVLDWKKEQLTLDVTLKRVEVNQFDPSRRSALFVEPSPPGYARVDLAELARQRQSDGSTTVRETIPAPEPRNRVRLKPPEEIREDGAAVKASRRTVQPQSSSSVLLPVVNLDELVEAPTPTAPGTPIGRTVEPAALSVSPLGLLER
jgi:hypothetical protein